MHLLIGCEIDALKLDRSLIEKLEIDKRTQVVVQSLLSMASSLNVATVAEGLESTSQVQRLRGLGCDMAQGYFFAKPMDREDIEKFISEPANRHLRLVS
jgi:EAL domain-containing protein (putative c-di-GMP-specific phosphodiesterase class I)